jgi:AraC-like DNA-binding protein/quercetin dioxygenase-like cupin family protein
MLKASYEVLYPSAGQSFLVQTFDGSGFKAPFHFHPEYELTLITAGSGKRYVGSHMADFRQEDLVLLGPNLPHCWKLEPPGSPAASIVIQFAADCLGQSFFTSAEFSAINRLLKSSQYGIRFPHHTVSSRIHSLVAETDDFRRLITFLELLQELAMAPATVLLDTNGITADLNPADREKLHPIFAYLVENFRGPISLKKAAAIAGMSPNAFCRYFKKITRKTFMDMVIRYRLDHAARQLVRTNAPVSTICFDSGFGDISHFYKMFRSHLHVSPLSYRKKFMHGTTVDSLPPK